ncbi:ABC transporter substrate-binding protein [Paralcaligenes sp. KSB-10]|uniref:ABC transporter substrate-binding protein n=1 Tax=Paralcaligenes sp. KSB-10 TaxID=2901142 RepID=UPI001E4937B9|nr:ABC transporter substrate-binding protein [Paralcaligenes sp. KSB-10]UHL65250.1 ABC transporter substrate-binding protein [Paralcaligenes sp. KSB-10]
MSSIARILKYTAVASALAACAMSTAQAADKITIMVGGINKIIYLPAKLADNLGYFKAEGLNVDLLSEPAGVNAENEMLAGAVQGVVGFYDHSIDLQAKGKNVESIVQFSQAPGEVEVIAAKQEGKIKGPADFKGKTLGVTGLGSSTDFLTQYMAFVAGLKHGDYTILPVGAGNTFIASIQQNRIDAGMTTDPTVTQLVASGQGKVLVDMRTPADTEKALGGLYPAASLYMPNAWVDSHKAEAQKLANAFVKTMKYIHTHSAEEIADKMPKDYYAGNKDLYIKALKASMPMFTADGRMPENGPPTVLKVLSTFKPQVKAAHIDLSKTYTTAFVDAANKK